jgi:hypothetical protein
MEKLPYLILNKINLRKSHVLHNTLGVGKVTGNVLRGMPAMTYCLGTTRHD